jgi:hypothetical protein
MPVIVPSSASIPIVFIGLFSFIPPHDNVRKCAEKSLLDLATVLLRVDDDVGNTDVGCAHSMLADNNDPVA